MKLVKRLANLGYGSRREVEALIKSGVVTDLCGKSLTCKDFPEREQMLVRGESLEPAAPLVILLNKPEGYTCSREDPGETVYDLLPNRFAKRNPGLNPIGRLDKDTTGLLLMTDDGKYLHKIIHPKSACLKTYHALLDRPLRGDEAEVFGSGELILENDTKPLLPAGFQAINEKEAYVMLQEGRYHQVRRMFAAVGNHVLSLSRTQIGQLTIPIDLAEGEWRILSQQQIHLPFAKD